jgi:DNA-binding XRE family transcriptional regulator/desulfoferrodoxin (superoxide reductase-like protein)
MNNYVTGAAIRELREKNGMTQSALADRIGVSAQAVSKWENGRGLPDIALIEPLAKALGISVVELISGEYVTNKNRASNMKRSSIYVCPICGNVIRSTGEAVISCCGVTLPALDAEEPDSDSEHDFIVKKEGGEIFVSTGHDMWKTHYISFFAYVTDQSFETFKLYPEGIADAYFADRGHGYVYMYCNRHGLFRKRV